MNKQVIDIQGTLYIIHRVVDGSNIPNINQDVMKEWCDLIGCEKIFKKENKYYFVNQITDIDYEQIT